MKLIKKWGALIVAIFMLAVIGVLVLVGLKTVNSYKVTLEQQQATIDDMSHFIDDEVGPMVDCYVVNQSVRVGDEITEEMLDAISVPEKIAYGIEEIETTGVDADGNEITTTEKEKTLNVVTNLNDVVGQTFRVDMNANTILMTDYVTESKLDNTSRYYQLIVDDFPTDINIGDYVDLRIKFTYGEDFIALPHKRIESMELGNGLFTLIFTENEINTYNSMLLDKALYESTTVYMLKYVDNSSQTAAEGYYPVNNNIAEVIAANPNILELVKAEMAIERQQLSAMMGGSLDSLDSKALNDIQGEIRDIRKDILGDKSSSIKDRIKAEAAAAKAAAKANK